LLTREEHQARLLCEKIYGARGDMENRTKECQLDLYADRTSAQTRRANQNNGHTGRRVLQKGWGNP
jgi:Transposase DDE domain group 1